MKMSCAQQLRQHYRPRRASPPWLKTLLCWF
jgi:hypothetical protein